MSYKITIERIETETKETEDYRRTGAKAPDGSDVYAYVKVTKPVTETTVVYQQRTEKEIEIKPLIDAFNKAIMTY